MTADLADLQLVLAWKHFIFFLSRHFEFYNFLHIFSADSVWAARHWESAVTGRGRGLSNWPPLQTAEGEGNRYRKSGETFNSPLASVGFHIPNYFRGYFSSGVSSQFVTRTPFPVLKQVLQCHIWLFFNLFCLLFSPFSTTPTDSERPIQWESIENQHNTPS